MQLNYYDTWQLEKYGNILAKQQSFYADEDHDEWKDSYCDNKDLIEQ